MRPTSIVNFERLYLGAIALGVINSFLSWDRSLALLRAQPTVQFGPGFLIATATIGVAIQLLLWFFIARRGSVAAKWIFIVLVAIGLLALTLSFVRNPTIGGVTGILGLVTYALQIAAALMLFRPDARAWLGGGRGQQTPGSA